MSDDKSPKKAIYLFAGLFSCQFLGRTILDWFFPPTSFYMRSVVTAGLSAGILIAAGLWAGWRSDSFVDGAKAGIVTAALASVIIIAVSAVLLLIWHDPKTLFAIENSGGLTEAFTLPLAMIFPGFVLGMLGVALFKLLKRIYSADR